MKQYPNSPIRCTKCWRGRIYREVDSDGLDVSGILENYDVMQEPYKYVCDKCGKMYENVLIKKHKETGEVVIELVEVKSYENSED